jgi:hypothetical protein
MRIDVSEIMEDENGAVYFKHYTKEEEFPDSEGRHCDLCVVCGFKAYPECRDWCVHAGYEREKQDMLKKSRE